MKKKLLTLTLAFALMFTMAVPSFAGMTNIFKKPTVNYLAFGDSVGAGCKNMNFAFGEDQKNNPGFVEFQGWYTDDSFTTLSDDQSKALKNSNVYAVPNSFVYKVAKAINADKKNSYNNTYVGYRLLDACRALDIPEYQEGDYLGPKMSDEEMQQMIDFYKMFGATDEDIEAMLNASDYQKGDAYNSSIQASTGLGLVPFSGEVKYDENGNFGSELEAYKNIVAPSLIQQAQSMMNVDAMKAAGTWEEAWQSMKGQPVTDYETFAPVDEDNDGQPDKYFEEEQDYIDWINGYNAYLQTDDYQNSIPFKAQVITTALMAKAYNLSFNTMFNDVNKANLQKAVKEADVITVELGLNDLMAAMQNDPVLSQIYGMITGMGMMMPMSGVELTPLTPKNIASSVTALLKQHYYYFDELIKYIKENNPDAILVVGTLVDPIRDYKVYTYDMTQPMTMPTYDSLDDYLHADMYAGMAENQLAKDLIAMLEPALSKAFPLLNNHIKKGAVTTKYSILGKKQVRNYYVADLTAARLNPPKDPVSGVTYINHPNVKEQGYIANAYIAQIKKAQVEQGKISNTFSALFKGTQSQLEIKTVTAKIFKDAVKGSIDLIKQIGQLFSAPRTGVIDK